MVEIYEHFIQTNSLMSIRSVFLSGNKRGPALNYSQLHHRKALWSESKMTNFIETLVEYQEVPPFVVYIKGEGENEIREVVDGKQRCDAIDKYINGKFRLKSQGLDKLWHLAGKKFSQLDENLKNRIKNTKLRFIIVKARNEKGIDPHVEELMKRDLFRRYNIGMSPLKKEEVYNAQYLHDEITLYFKNRFKQNIQIYSNVQDIFDHRKRNIETMMQHIRQLLVLHNIPISRYANERDDIVNKYYDHFSYNIVNNGQEEDIQRVFDDFVRKLHFLLDIKSLLDKEKAFSNGLVYECIYWAVSVCEMENVKFDSIDNPVFKSRIVEHIAKRAQSYMLERSNFIKQVKSRYELIAYLFSSQLDVDFTYYLRSNEEFLAAHKERMVRHMKERFMPGLEDMYFPNPTPTNCSVIDLLDEMKEGKFYLRPPYQRDESMSIAKASSLIESMLSGIMLYPIYVYCREDGVKEVIDGQQRLLAILGFIGEEYRNENGDMEVAKKHEFSLKLKLGDPMFHLQGKKFKELPDAMKRRIESFSLSIIEIKEKECRHFKPAEYFKRINHKSFPIKENSFEHWNACTDVDIASAVKDLFQRNSWLYLRKEDKRMFNEELVTCLCYLHYMKGGILPDMHSFKEVLSIYPSSSCITVKIRQKSYITQILQDSAFKEEFLLSFNSFEADFIEKVALMTSNPGGKTSAIFRNKQLDAILQTGRIRVAANFYVLWLIVRGVPIDYIEKARSTVRSRISKVFSLLKTTRSVEKFENAIIETWNLAD